MTGFYDELTLSKNVLYSVFQGKVEDRLSSGYFFPFSFSQHIIQVALQ